MILIAIKKWTPVAGIEHLTTTWEVATDKDFTNIVERKEASVEKDVFFSELAVPTGATYYVRGKRHMNDPSADFYSDTIIIQGKREDVKGILLLEDFYIDTPSIYVDEDELATEGSFEIRSSRFRGNMDSHDYTHWIILDSYGKTLWQSLYDTEHKLSIVCPIATEIRSKNNIKILCIHGSLMGIESHPGKYEIGSTESNFEITCNLEELKAYKDNEITFKAIDASKGIGISLIELIDGSQNDKIIRSWNNIMGTITIPWHESLPGGNMYLRFRFINNVDKAAVLEKPVFFATGFNSELIRPNGIWNVTMSNYIKSGVLDVMPCNNCITETAFNGDVFLPVYDSDVKLTYLYNYRIDKQDDNKLKCVVVTPSLNTEDTTERIHVIDWASKLDGAYIRHVHGDMLLVDAINDDGYPTFTFFQKHPNPSYGREYYAIHQSIRQDETKSLGHTGAMIQTDNEYMLYIPVGSHKIKQYNLRSGEIRDEVTIPASFASTSKNLTMFKVKGKNKVVILGGNDVNTLIYNYETGKFEEGFFVVPQSFAGVPLKCIQTQNGDILILKSSSNDEDQDTDLLFYKQGDDKPKPTGIRFSRSISYPTTIVLREDLRIDFISKSTDSNILNPDVTYPNTDTYRVQSFE